MLTFKLQPTTENMNFCRELVTNINKDYPNAASIRTLHRQVWVDISEKYEKYVRKYVLTHCNLKEIGGKYATL